MNSISPVSSLVVPLTFPTLSELSHRHLNITDLVECSCSACKPTSLVSWGFTRDPLNHAQSLTGRGVVIGCEDGTLYIFLPSQNFPHPPGLINPQFLEPSYSSGNSSRLAPSRQFDPTSRSPSPSSFVSHHAPFQVSSRSPVVSGVTTEQVEAPKIFVDFDDEPDKLMEMLKGRSPRDKTFVEVIAPTPSVDGSALPGLKRREDAKSLLSATNSPVPIPNLQLPQDLPKIVPEISFSLRHLSLRCHIIPSCSGPGRPIVGIQMLDNTRLIVALQESGWALNLARVLLP